ncbi:hypothetical protein GCM10009849_29370 [Sinomonas flava]|uniref:Uncharacterized protein n=1 Tax=Sinomonas flava TaxID=496857 RepID=A0ABP5NRC6_9MICC
MSSHGARRRPAGALLSWRSGAAGVGAACGEVLMGSFGAGKGERVFTSKGKRTFTPAACRLALTRASAARGLPRLDSRRG